jgi:hypothetical protein
MSGEQVWTVLVLLVAAIACLMIGYAIGRNR